MAQYCVEASGRIGPTSVDVPPVDLTHFADPDATDLRPALGLSEDDEVVLYMGSFFEFSGLDVVVRDLAAAAASRPRLRLVLVGGGELEPELHRLVDSLKLGDRVLFTGIVPYAQLPQYLRVADVALNPFRPEQVTHVALPHKVLQYMAAEIPVVSTDLHGLRGVIGDDSGVTFVPAPGDVLAAAIRLFDRPHAERRAIAETQRSTALETFSETAAADGFERLLASVG
jgi:glycosyltransferase involved in cell wall biosynthesis